MNWLSPSLDGIRDLPPVAIVLVVAVLALLESAAFVGLLVPGESAVIIGGAVAQSGRVNAVVLMCAVAAGATAGDSISYSIGRHTGARLPNSRVGALIGPERVEAATNYLHHRGAKAVFFGRFVPVVRTGVPVLAGVSRMRYQTFLTWNLLGAMLWSVLHVGIGYAAGSSAQRLEHAIGFSAVIVLGIVGLIIARRRRTHEHRSRPWRPRPRRLSPRSRDRVQTTSVG